MKIQLHSPGSAPKPASSYAQGVTVTDASRWILVSGQVGLRPDGTPAGDTASQMRQCFRNIFAVLEDARMSRTSVVKLTAFLVDRADVALYRDIRDEMMDGHVAASTLLVVDALAHPDWRVEIEATACA